jgi:hypothetical protein
MKNVSPNGFALFFLASLTQEAKSYAVDAARGEHRGFAALHDLMDANEALAGVMGIEDFDAARDTPAMNAVIEEINRLLLA